MLSDDELDHDHACEPDSPVSFLEQEELAFIKRMMALPDSRPDPGAYRTADSENLLLDLLELERIYSRPDPRPFMRSWRPYLTEGAMSEDPCE